MRKDLFLYGRDRVAFKKRNRDQTRQRTGAGSLSGRPGPSAHRRIRDYPYLYDGSREYEEEYLQSYVRSANSIAILALSDGAIVGASTGLPLLDETEEFQRPFLAQGREPRTIFYCGESVLLKEFRGHGVYRRFFAGREEHARSLGGMRECVFCCVQRPVDHALRPRDHVPLDDVWRRFGYEERPDLRTTFHWKDLDQPGETEKPMIFWTKTLERHD